MASAMAMSTRCSRPKRASRAPSQSSIPSRSDIVWWETHAQAPQLLADGEVVDDDGGQRPDIRRHPQRQAALLDHLGPSDLESGSLGHSEGIEACCRGEAVHRFRGATERLAEQTKYISYGPVRKSAATWSMPRSPASCRPPTANFETALQNDFQFWADHGDELNERFNVWLNQ